MAKTAYADIDAYIAAQPEAAQAVLQQVRAAIRAALPDAAEAISYQIPAFKVGGRVAIFFAGWKTHWSIYPVFEDLLVLLGEDLGGFERSKGTLRFPLDKPVPVELVQRLAAAMAEQTLARVAAAKSAKKPQ